MGGEHSTATNKRFAHNGSSPRGRGTPVLPPASSHAIRVIPAWAGNTFRRRSASPGPPGHPRMGGEHYYRLSKAAGLCGSSPRGRGTRSPARRRPGESRVIPAWAGNTPSAPPAYSPASGHPRVGGEHFSPVAMPRALSGSSPRGRGTHPADRRPVPVGRVIPAWAGNTREPGPPRPGPAGHPRVGGEHP